MQIDAHRDSGRVEQVANNRVTANGRVASLRRRTAASGVAGWRRAPRRGRRIGLSLAVAAVGGVVPAAPVAASPLCVSATGTVRDLYGVPIPAAVVAMSSPDCGTSSVVADANGRYTIPVQTSATEQAEAWKPGYKSA